MLNILKDNWNPANTDDHTPKFIKITELKKYDFNENKDIIAAHRLIPDLSPAGIGDVNKHEFENFNLDVRTMGEKEETHFLDVIREVLRILKSKKVNPLSSVYTENHVLEFNGVGPDLSDKTHWIWRKLIPVQFLRYKVIR